jgi:DNA (cytosine-5)-methyltransferase 1
MGYSRAGFDVVGVDIEHQAKYPFAFRQADALAILDSLIHGECLDLDPAGYWLEHFDAIHASPPCQAFTALRTLHQDRDYPELIASTRDLLLATSLPYVIENVPGAALHEPVVLCGSMFGLEAKGRQLRRHRLFECSFPTMRPSCQHIGQPVGVYGHGGGGDYGRGYKGNSEEYREAMGIGWASKAEIAQAIPPAYTEHIGYFLMAQVMNSQKSAEDYVLQTVQ